MEKISNYINGELAPPISGDYIDNYNPATGEVYSHIPDSDARYVNLAVAAAEKEFVKCSVTAAANRAKIMMRIPDLI